MPSRVFFQSKKINSDYTLLLFPFYCKEHFKQQILSCMQIIVGNINNVTLNSWTNPSVITQHSDLRHQSNNIYNIKIYNHNNLSYNIQFETQVLIYFFFPLQHMNILHTQMQLMMMLNVGRDQQKTTPFVLHFHLVTNSHVFFLAHFVRDKSKHTKES